MAAARSPAGRSDDIGVAWLMARRAAMRQFAVLTRQLPRGDERRNRSTSVRPAPSGERACTSRGASRATRGIRPTPRSDERARRRATCRSEDLRGLLDRQQQRVLVRRRRHLFDDAQTATYIDVIWPINPLSTMRAGQFGIGGHSRTLVNIGGHWPTSTLDEAVSKFTAVRPLLGDPSRWWCSEILWDRWTLGSPTSWRSTLAAGWRSTTADGVVADADSKIALLARLDAEDIRGAVILEVPLPDAPSPVGLG